MFAFRLPFNMPTSSRLSFTEDRYDLFEDGVRHAWIVSSRAVGEPLNETGQLVIRGEGYTTEEKAATDGERCRDILSRAFAQMHMAADFGDRGPFATLTTAGAKLMSEQAGFPVMADVPGVTTFDGNADVHFMRVTADLGRSQSPDRTRQVLEAAVGAGEAMNGAERLAFDLYSGSFFQPSADGRLMMLMMAIETLLTLEPRSDAARAHVAALIESTKVNPDLNESERTSIRSSWSGSWMSRSVKPADGSRERWNH